MSVNKFTSILMIVILTITPCFAIKKKQLTKLQQTQHGAMHEIVMVERTPGGEIIQAGLCTAYAVGSHTLLTAEHCNAADTNDIYVDPISREAIRSGEIQPHDIINRQFDQEDHMLVDIKGVDFKDTVYLGPNVRLPIQGEHTYSWGCPHGIRDQYREGLVTGSVPVKDLDADEDIKVTGLLYIVQEAVIGGDSGSAVFSAVDGKLIGVVTFRIEGGIMMGMFPIMFTGEQIENAAK